MQVLSSSSNLKSSHQYDLFQSENEPYQYHNVGAFGFFSILAQIPNQEQKSQRSYRLTQMAQVIQCLPKDRDTWLSQAEFIQPNRRIVNLARISLFFVDIDCYTVGIRPEQAYELARLICEENHFPYPSISINSGRGLQIKWFFEKSIPRHALPRWNATQAMLVDMFREIGADPNAKDASRVLRLIDTVNTKSGVTVYVHDMTTDSDGMPLKYDFEQLCVFRPEDSLLDKKKSNHPFSVEEQQAMAAAREARQITYDARQVKSGLHVVQGDKKNALRGFSGRQLAWHRVEDIRALTKMRDGVQQGQSMSTLFWALNFLLLSGATTSNLMWHEAAALCREFGFGDFSRKDDLSTLYRRAKDYGAGKTIEYQGRVYPSLYVPRNDTLINIFGITDDEQRKLKTIISKDMAKERDAARALKKRQDAGAMSRAAYLSRNDDGRVAARLMRAAGKSIREIARELNAPKSTVSDWVSEVRPY